MNNGEFTVNLKKIVEEFDLETIYKPDDADERKICTSDILRPGLQLATRFEEYFNTDRIMMFGNLENAYMKTLESEDRYLRLKRLFSHHSPALIVARGLDVYPEIVKAAQECAMPVYRTKVSTSPFMAALIGALNVHLAPRISRHGVLVEVYGEGILLLGESGVGKSETAIELLKRGHRLVADDAVDIRRVSSITLVGSSPAVIKHFVEIRGIGIVDVQKIFGMGAVKDTEKIDFILNFEPWQEDKEYDRLGMETQYTELLGIKIPSITVPVKPGRNLAVIVEVAAMNHRQKKMGYSAVDALNKRLAAEFGNN